MRTSTTRSHNSTRRWARLGLASVLALAACPPAPPAPPPAPRLRPPPPPFPVTPGPEGGPELRVGLVVGASSVTLGGDGELLLTDDGSGERIGLIPRGVSWTVVPDTAGLRLVQQDGSRTERYRGIAAVNVTANRFAMANARRYRGRLHVMRDASGLTVLNRVPVESYLAGVLGGEIGVRSRNETQAVLAQAVVSRSFALKNRGRREAQGFDAWADVRDQVYNGVSGETPEVWQAVRATTGEVLRYRGEIADAFFHSTCGFSTAAVDEAFKTAQPRPYLRSVSDASRGGHYYCDISPQFRWREEWDGPKLRAILSRTLPAAMSAGGDGPERVTDVAVTRTSSSGRVAELRIAHERGDVRVPGPDVRSVLRPQPDRLLQSTAFQLSVTRQDGLVTRLVAVGAGSGHGVGLCQWGAVGRARAGQKYRKILATYFPGTTVDQLY